MRCKIILLIFSVSAMLSRNPAYSATVGNPLDLDVPARSGILREEIINNTLDKYEQIVKIKASLDLEFLFDKDLNTPSEVSNAEIKGQWYMGKLGVTLFNRVEPYFKVGFSELEAKWRQGGTNDIEVKADDGLAWGGGIKGIIWEFDNSGLRITGDIQYRITEPDVSDISLAGSAVNDTGADFKVEEWQASILMSKKFELPLKWQSVYIVPYTGLSLSDSTVDVEFKNPANPGADNTLYEANNDSIYGFIFGCDIMPALTSSFIYSMELRLLNELSLTLGGTMKF